MNEKDLIAMKNAQLNVATKLLYIASLKLEHDPEFNERVNDWMLAVKTDKIPE